MPDPSPPDGDSAGLEGRSLGDFRLKEKISEGGFGVVYRAEQPALAREVVVKVLRTQARDPDAVRRFVTEAQLASRLEHPYAAHIYAFGAEKDGVAWIAMEIVRGTSLAELLASHGAMTPASFVPLFEKICEVVHSAHELGIVHRDLKPANVMVLSRAGRLLPKLLDFGLSKFMDPAVLPVGTVGVGALEGRDFNPSNAVTLAPMSSGGVVAGTPAYMSPEQWETPNAVDARSDVYSLGVIAFEALSGRLPFEGRTMQEMVRAHLGAAPPLLGPGLDLFDPVIARAMAKRPRDRFASTLELAAAARRAAGLDGSDLLPVLDETVREAAVAGAPRPLAETVAALAAARNEHEALAYAALVVKVALNWVGLLAAAWALAEAPGTELGLVQGDAQWLEFARARCRPDAAAPERARLPPLVSLLFDQAGRNTSWSRLADELTGLGTGPVLSREAARKDLAHRMERLAEFLLGLRPLFDYPLGSTAGERWMGARRGRALPSDHDEPVHPILIDPWGRKALELWPFVLVAPPAPGEADEVFLFEGRGGRGARWRAWPWGFERRETRVRGGPFDVTQDLAPWEGERSPWPGLRSYGPSDAAVFLGREGEVDAFRNRLLVEPLLAVVGPSGAGKSSFVEAGVVPALPEGWRAVRFRPGPSPLAALAAAFPPGTARAEETVVLVVDQLEELFTQTRSPEERDQFAVALDAASRSAANPVRVVLTIRDDFLLRAEQLPGIGARLGRALVILNVPSRANLERILIAPAERAGYAFEDPALVTEMVDSVAARPGALALLSFAAAALWERRDAGQKLLSRAAYAALGGVGGALARHAEETLASMPAGRQLLVRKAFQRLLTAEGTRAAVTRAELLEVLGTGGEEVLERLVTARLLVASDGGEDSRVEIAHEVLVTAWPRLQRWREEDAEGARLHHQLRTAARQWKERGQATGLLWRDEALAEFRLWEGRRPGQSLTAEERAFANACLAEADRTQRVRRRLVGVSFVLLGIIAAGFWQLNARTTRSLATLKLEEGRQAVLRGDAIHARISLAEAKRLGGETRLLGYLDSLTGQALARQGPLLSGVLQPDWGTLSTDGSRALTAGKDGAKLWNARDGALIATLEPELSRPPPRFLLAGTAAVTAHDGQVRFWNSVTGAAESSVAVGRGELLAFDVSADAGTLLTLTRPDRNQNLSVIGLYRVSDGATLKEIPVVDNSQWLAFAPDGRSFLGPDAVLRDLEGAERARLLSIRLLPPPVFMDPTTLVAVSADGRSATAISLPSGTPLRTFDQGNNISRLAVSPDGTRLVIVSRDGPTRLWDARRGKLLVASEELSQMEVVSFSPDGNRFLVAGGGRNAWIRDVSDGSAVFTLQGHSQQVSSAAFGGGGKRVITTSNDGTSRLWNLGEEPVARMFLAPPSCASDRLWSSALAPDGRHVALSRALGQVELWDLESRSRVASFPGMTQEVYRAAFSPDGLRLAAGGLEGTRVWNVADQRLLLTLSGHRERVWYLEFSPDGRRLVTSSWDGTARVWDSITGASLAVLQGHDNYVWEAHFSPDGTKIATASEDGTVRLWDAATGACLRVIQETGGVGTVGWSADGKRLVTGGRDLNARIRDEATGDLISTLVGHTSGIDTARFTLDGRFVVTASHDTTVKVWDAESGALLVSLQGHRSPINTAEPSPDGKWLLTSAQWDDAVKLWRFPIPAVTPRASRQ